MNFKKTKTIYSEIMMENGSDGFFLVDIDDDDDDMIIMIWYFFTHSPE